MLSLQSRLWETQKQLQQLRRQTAHMETLAVPMMLGAAHRPLSRTQSSPASTSLTLPDKALPLTTAPEPPQSQPRFTTGTESPPITRRSAADDTLTLTETSMCVCVQVWCMTPKCWSTSVHVETTAATQSMLGESRASGHACRRGASGASVRYLQHALPLLS